MVQLRPKSVLQPPAKEVWQRPANVDSESMVRLRPESDLPLRLRLESDPLRPAKIEAWLRLEFDPPPSAKLE